MESFGSICAEALTFLSELGHRMCVVTGDMREKTFLFQHLSIAIQRFNCILFKSSFIDGEIQLMIRQLLETKYESDTITIAGRKHESGV